jgi:methionyl-tRNA formyltransferase
MINLFLGTYISVLRVMMEYHDEIHVIIESKNTNSDIHKFCIHHDLHFYFVENEKDIENLVLYSQIGLVFVASFGLILTNKIIGRCHEIYNFHPGDLYKFRGRHPLPSAILSGAETMALSVHKIDSDRIDSGPMYSQIFLKIDYKKSYSENHERLQEALPFLAESICNNINEGREVPCWDWQISPDSYKSRLDAETLRQMINAENLLRYVK